MLQMCLFKTTTELKSRHPLLWLRFHFHFHRENWLISMVLSVQSTGVWASNHQSFVSELCLLVMVTNILTLNSLVCDRWLVSLSPLRRTWTNKLLVYEWHLLLIRAMIYLTDILYTTHKCNQKDIHTYTSILSTSAPSELFFPLDMYSQWLHHCGSVAHPSLSLLQ